MKQLTVSALISTALISCSPVDEADLVYDVSSKTYFVAQWGDYREYVTCPDGLAEDTIASVKPHRKDTLVARPFSGQITVSDEKIGWRTYNRAAFYACKEPGKDA